MTEHRQYSRSSTFPFLSRHAWSSWVSELAPPDQNWNEQQYPKEQGDQDERFRRNPYIADNAKEPQEDPDRSGYAAGLAAPRAESGQQQKHDEPKQTDEKAREHRIKKHRIAKARYDLAPRKRPPQPGEIDHAVNDSDQDKKQSGGNHTDVRNGFSFHVSILRRTKSVLAQFHFVRRDRVDKARRLTQQPRNPAIKSKTAFREAFYFQPLTNSFRKAIHL
jgi:hypothetical protein